MSIVRTIRKTASRAALGYFCRRACADLERKESEAAKRLSRALKRFLDGEWEAADTERFRAIEGMRTRLAASEKTVQVQDFGAVSGSLDLDVETMQHGRFETRRISSICTTSAKSEFWCRCLYSLVREFRPKVGVELGTSLGISASYQASAMALNGGGELNTFEGSPALADEAKGTFGALSLKNINVVVGPFNETLGPSIEKLPPIDYAFIDGHHHGESTIAYFDTIRARASQQACFVFDDIRWSDGMKDAWNQIARQPEVAEAIDLRSIGVVVLK